MYDRLNNTAVLFIDVMNPFDFDGGHKLLNYTEGILQNLVALKQFAKTNNLPIIYINDHYGLWQGDSQKIIHHCLNEQNREVIHSLKPDDEDYFLIKPMHSAFYQTPLQSLLSYLERTHLLIGGIAGDICILFTAQDAYMYQYTMHIPKNCMVSEEKEGNDYALYLMHSVMKANIEAFHE